MGRPQLEDQDEVLVRLAMWPYPGVKLEDVPKDKRKPIYDARNTLANMLTPVRLPGVERKKYRSADVDQLIERSQHPEFPDA
jgi:hypothetical protein